MEECVIFIPPAWNPQQEASREDISISMPFLAVEAEYFMGNMVKYMTWEKPRMNAFGGLYLQGGPLSHAPIN